MAAFIGRFIAKKILAERLENSFGTEDPYFEQVPATRLDGKPPGKVKKRRKALPPGISEHDGKVLTKVKRRAYRLDMSLFSFMGLRFGWGSVIGLIPGFGDVLDALLGLMVLKTCMQVEGGLPSGVKMKMLMNIAFDFVIGIVPFIGDVADAAFRANSRNALLLETYLREQGRKELQRNGLPVPAVDPSDPAEFDRSQRAEVNSVEASTPSGQAPMPAAPPNAQVRENRGWFSRSRANPRDVEAGNGYTGSNTTSSKQQRTSRR
ncbi:hypothetical protein S40285_00392 [Stachybotrys chlorohalonatus IBT 40285]|uniref:PH domain-containing protein n=1 Tax=Stachybotrys chlorohalonatus (strain IBT 40285) TaxID=1283841 RepID=A0A084QHU2_STAC4|nr:hypothetical protein S40285_00392 [Stachybotrys chlorohalonata IBT 40285]